MGRWGVTTGTLMDHDTGALEHTQISAGREACLAQVGCVGFCSGELGQTEAHCVLVLHFLASRFVKTLKPSYKKRKGREKTSVWPCARWQLGRPHWTQLSRG